MRFVGGFVFLCTFLAIALPTEVLSRDVRGVTAEFALGYSPVGYWPNRVPRDARTISAVTLGYGLGWGVSESDAISVSLNGVFSTDYSYRVAYTLGWYHFVDVRKRWHTVAGGGYLKTSYDSGTAKNLGGCLLLGGGYEVFTYLRLESSVLLGLAEGDRGTELHGNIQIVAKFLYF